MVRWVAFAGVVSVLVTLLLALTRSSAAVVRDGETPSTTDTTSDGEIGVDGDTEDSGHGETTRVRDVFGDDGLFAPLPWRSDDEPADPLSGPGGTELTTLDESDYPDPPPDHARPDAPDGPSEAAASDELTADDRAETGAVPDPSEAFPISGEAEYTDPDLPADDRVPGRGDPDDTGDTGDADGSPDTDRPPDTDRSADHPALGDSEPDDPPTDESFSEPPLGPDGDPLDRTGCADRWDGDGAGHDRWMETDATPEDRWRDRSTDALDGGDGPNEAAGVDDTATPGVATATSEPGLTPDAFDGPDTFDEPDPFAGETDGFDPQLPSEQDGVRVGDRELSTTVLLANVVGSQLLFAGLLAAVTIWAAVPATALGLGSVTLSQVAVGALLGVALWVASESGGRLGRRLGVDPAEALRGALAPTTRREWWLLLGLVLPVVAVFEELLFRAALVGAFAAGFDVPVAALVVGSSVVFGLAHAAQGRVGMAVTGLLGVVLATAFVLTGSLVVVVVAHYVVNAAEFVVHEGPVGQFPTE